jgi:hypothetical protein
MQLLPEGCLKAGNLCPREWHGSELCCRQHGRSQKQMCDAPASCTAGQVSFTPGS